MPSTKSRRRREPDTTTPSAVIYCRVSTRAQAEEGVSLDAQLMRCREHAARMSFPIIAEHRDEGLSGKDSIEDRPGLSAAISAVRSTPGAVLLAYSVSRVARRQRVLWHILDDRDGLGVPFVSATEPFDTSTPMGKAMLGMLAVWSQLEADMIGERTRDGLAEVRARGVRLGAPDMLRLGASDSVRLARELYDSGAYSHRSLADELNRRAVPTAKGNGRWWPKTVRAAVLAGQRLDGGA